MLNEPRWLTADHAIRFNERAVAETNEPFQLRDRGLLESAMANPVNHWHYGERSVAKLAALLLLSLARNHAFAQGNKRVALLVADAFLTINGYRLQYPDDRLANLILAVLTHEIDEAEFLQRFTAAVVLPRRPAFRFKTAPAGTFKGPRLPRTPGK